MVSFGKFNFRREQMNFRQICGLVAIAFLLLGTFFFVLSLAVAAVFAPPIAYVAGEALFGALLAAIGVSMMLLSGDLYRSSGLAAVAFVVLGTFFFAASFVVAAIFNLPATYLVLEGSLGVFLMADGGVIILLRRVV
jgi:hypothetical protein